MAYTYVGVGLVLFLVWVHVDFSPLGTVLVRAGGHDAPDYHTGDGHNLSD